MFRFIIRVLYLPLFLVGGNALAIGLVSAGYSKLWLIVLGIGFVLLAFVLEAAAPFDKNFNRPQGDRLRDFLHAFFNEAANIGGLLLLPLVSGLLVFPSLWPTELALWQQLLIAIFIADIGITLVHFASHKLDILWRLHAVHHSVKRMYGFNGLMKHPLHQLLETLAGTTPLLLLGVPQQVLTLLVVAVVLQLLLQHSNVNYFTGPLKYLLAINKVHRFHHLKTAEEGDVNFGLFTQFTDMLLGTRFYDKHRIISVGDLGIGQQPNYPDGYLQQLLQPFRR